jgi:hypothetical protein
MRASQECLDIDDINKINAPDPSSICVTSNGFVNSLNSGRLSSSTVKFGLGISQVDGGFWAESGRRRVRYARALRPAKRTKSLRLLALPLRGATFLRTRVFAPVRSP